jgi:hypothetical protein
MTGLPQRAEPTLCVANAEVAKPRARGVTVEEYDMPGLKTEDGIADLGFAWMAWIVDPGKNALAIMEFKE